MALTFTNKIEGAIRTWKLGPLQMAEVDITMLNADYSSGLALATNAAKMGFRKVFGVIGLGAKNGAGTYLPLINFNWDFVAGKLRVNNATSEANASATLTDGSVVRVLVFGV